MKKIPSKQYTEEFKREAVRLVLEQGLSASEVGRRLDVRISLIVTGRFGST